MKTQEEIRNLYFELNRIDSLRSIQKSLHKLAEERSEAEKCIEQLDRINDLIVTNRYGQQLRNPAESDKHTEGYTPFGDE